LISQYSASGGLANVRADGVCVAERVPADGGRTVVNPPGAGEVTSSVRWTSSPRGEDSAAGVFCFDGMWSTFKKWSKKASPLGEVGGVGLLAELHG